MCAQRARDSDLSLQIQIANASTGLALALADFSGHIQCSPQLAAELDTVAMHLTFSIRLLESSLDIVRIHNGTFKASEQPISFTDIAQEVSIVAAASRERGLTPFPQ